MEEGGVLDEDEVVLGEGFSVTSTREIKWRFSYNRPVLAQETGIVAQLEMQECTRVLWACPHYVHKAW